MQRCVLLLAFILLLGLGSCWDSSPSGKLRIAVIPKGTSHEFWKAVENGARRAAAELGDVEIIWKGPTGEGDEAGQIRIFENATASGYDGICLAPLDAIALERKVREAIGAQIPVLIFDSALSNDDVPIVSFVATDNYRGGQVAGEHLAKLLGGEGRVILLPYQIGSASTIDREKGFLDAIAKHPGIEVLAKDKYGGHDEAKAREVSEGLLSVHGEQVDGFFASNESNVSGLLTALQKDPRGLLERVQVVGFDSGPIINAALAAGTLKGVVVQDPVRMGYESVKAMVAHLRDEEVPRRISTGETLITPENHREPRHQELLYPLDSQ